MGKDLKLRRRGMNFIYELSKYKYAYHFTWLGRPIIQLPQDIIAIQEIIWKVKPDLILETGIAHGGSLILSSAILELLDHGKVVGIDIDIRAHNKIAIQKHPLYKRIIMIEGSSIEKNTISKVKKFTKGKKKIIVILDSNHTHDHVLKELQLYSPFVKKGSYLIVLDTAIEDMPKKSFKNRPWDKKNNPKTAVREFLKTNNRFEIDKDYDDKLLITSAPKGYLKCIKT